MYDIDILVLYHYKDIKTYSRFKIRQYYIRPMFIIRYFQEVTEISFFNKSKVLKI